MKHRLTYLAAFLVLFIALGLSLLQPAVTQAAGGPGGGDPEAISDPPTLEETARADCNAAYPLGGNSAGSDSRRAKVNACTDAYVIVSKSPNKSKGDVCKNKSGDAAAGCDKGYDLAGGRDTPPDPKPTQSTAAYDFCHDAYPNQGGGTGAAAANAVKIDSCIAAFKSGSSGAGTAAEICKGKSGDAAAACRKGANAGIRAKAKGSVKADEPGSDANGEASPNCENQGGPLGWILCGVFDIMSDGAQWIFANLLEPFLITAPVSTNPQDPSFQIWSNLRIYGNVFLIIALLVIVFGESIGGGMIDAYTAKKVLPRLLVAAILINLSIYIVGFLVDFTNILGKGVGILLTEPLTHCQGASGGNCWEFSPTVGDQARVFGVGIIGLLAGGTAVAGFLGTIIFGGFAGVSAILTVAFFVLLPMFFAVLAVFITLIIRKGLILMLVLVSPIAFALYCLPNTERFFRRWWELLIQTLMVYPIVIAIFGVAEILSITILASNGISPSDLQDSAGSDFVAGNLNRTLSLVVAFLLQFLPLLAVPFAFRIAGGAMGRIYEAATGAGQRINQLAENRREHAKRDYQSQALSARGRIYHNARGFGEKAGAGVKIPGSNRRLRVPGVRGLSRGAGRIAGGYNVEALLSAARAEKMKIIEDQIATGRDEEIRGLTVNKAAALASGKGIKKLQDGTYQDIRTGAAVDASQLGQYEYREEANGTRQFQSLGGRWIDEQDVDAGYGRWGKDQFAQQGALSYEMRKALSDDDRARIENKYATLATEKNGGWGMTKGEAYGAWIGSAFANQNTSLQYKYMNKDLTGGQHFDHGGFLDEVYEKRGSYDMSRMDATSIRRLREAWEDPHTTQEQRIKLRSIADTMDQRLRTSGGLEQVAGEDGQVQQQAAGMGPGHVNQAMADFVGVVRSQGQQ